MNKKSHRGTKDTEMKIKNNYYVRKENVKERHRGEDLNRIKKNPLRKLLWELCVSVEKMGEVR
jgi:hypothetical protein